MKLKLTLGISVLFFLIQTSAFALSGQQVYTKYKQNEKKMEKSIKTLIMVVEMNSAGTIAETTIYKKGKKIRVDSVIKKSANPMMGKAGQKTISIDDGVTTTIFHPMMGKMSTPSGQAKEDTNTVRNVKYLGKETVQNIKCHKIKVAFNTGDKETLWISAKDSVLIKEKSDEGSVIINSDFKKIKGFLMPYKTTVYGDGAVESSSKVKSAKAGVKIANSKFNPAKVKGFKSAKKKGKSQANGQSGQVMNMMEMAMEIQKLHMNGETEKAEALTKKMQQMQMGQ